MGNLLIVSFVYDYENIVHSTEHLESIEKCKEENSNNIILILEITVVRIFIYFLFDPCTHILTNTRTNEIILHVSAVNYYTV